MIAEFQQGISEGTVEAISSKSYAHRMLICAALSNNPSRLKCNILSQDMMATMQCLNALGAEIAYSNGYFNIIPINKNRLSNFIELQNSNSNVFVNLQCKECGSTLRFLLPVASALGINAEFNGTGRLPERPIGEILDLLANNGASIEGNTLPVKLSGSLHSGIMRISGAVSSQYITGLLMALPLLNGDSTIVVEGEQLSKPYIDITLGVLRQYGVKIISEGNSYFVKGGQIYSAPCNTSVEGDWSNAAFWVSIGAITGKTVTIDNIMTDSLQGDRAILSIAEEMGAHIVREVNNVTVIGGKLKSIEFDARNVPDIVPVIALMCHCANGKSIIKNVGRLRDKESDRLSGLIEIINAIGGKANCDDKCNLIIEGQCYNIKAAEILKADIYNSKSNRITLNGLKDHRMVMMSAIAGILYGNIVVTDVEAIDKSYPTFFNDLKSMGVCVRLEN